MEDGRDRPEERRRLVPRHRRRHGPGTQRSGRELERRLSAPQRERVAAAYRKAGAPAVEGFRKVLLGIIADEDDRRRFDRPRPPRR